MIPFLDLHSSYKELREPLNQAWLRVMDSGWYILGQEVEAFEHEFAEYCGSRHCVGVANGLQALELILQAYGIGAGDEVIVPSNTYIATWLAVSNVGATPKPVEPRFATANLDPELVEAAITRRTRAIVAVHLYGQPAEMGKLRAIAGHYKLRLIEDAAQAHGAQWKGTRTGSLGDAAGFSFYPGKNLGCYGDGGAVVTDDDSLADRVRVLRNYGSRQKYHNECRGTNSRLDELQAALLRVRIRVLDEWNGRRRRQASRYLAELGSLPALTLPSVAAVAQPVWHLFVIRCADRDLLQTRLSGMGVATMIHYPVPPHLSPAYGDLGCQRPSLPIAESLAKTVLSLPIGPHLRNEQQTTVIEALHETVGRRVSRTLHVAPVLHA
jgi:dTDP-4-amino-4,6-dideoxygalactose transaminase